MSNSSSTSPITLNPWLIFFIFLTTNTLLSYFSFSIAVDLWIGLLGIALPFFLALWAMPKDKNSSTPLYQREFFEKIPLWIWALIGALAVFMRFYRLTTLSAWPMYDEGLCSFMANLVSQKGIDRFFYSYAALTPFYPWFLSQVFRLFGSSIFNLWFWPALFSLLWAPIAYQVGQQYFSRSFSFFCAVFIAVGFWPCYIGRFSTPFCLLLPFATFCFLWLIRSLQRPSDAQGDRSIGIFGFFVGLGLFLFSIHWITPLVVMSATVLVLFYRKPIRLLFFALGLLPWLAAFLILALHSDSFIYLAAQSSLDPSSMVGGVTHFWDYPKALFWKANDDAIGYKPLWGGLINPVWGALFGLGLIEVLKNLSRPFYRWLLICFFVLLAPGVLSHNLEFFRIIAVLLVLVPLIGLGWARLNGSFSVKRSAIFLLVLLIPAFALDYHQLMNVYPHLWENPTYWLKEFKSINSYRADQMLEAKSSQGPGLVFSDLNPGLNDQTLALADHRFNAVSNDSIPVEKATWAAVLTNVNYQPFLAQRFGKGETYWLSKDLNRADGGLMLWVIDLNETNRPVFQRWVKATRALTPFMDQVYQDFGYTSQRSYPQTLLKLDEAYPLFQGDSFLECCFEDKKADFLYRVKQPGMALESLERAVQKGYPSANLFYALGSLEMTQHHEKEARGYFRKAVKAPLNFTQAELLLGAPAEGNERQ